jgi:hypothetical protein
MKKKVFIAISLFAIILTLVFLTNKPKQASDNPRGKTTFEKWKTPLEKVFEETKKRRFSFWSSEPSEELDSEKVSAKRLLPQEAKASFEILNTSNWTSGDQEKWNLHLERMRRNSDKVVPKIVKSLQASTIEETDLRFQLLYLLGEIGSDKSIPAIEEIMSMPIPKKFFENTPDKEIPGGRFLSVKSEALTALSLIALESETPQKPRKILLSAISSPHRSIRREAAMLLRETFPRQNGLKEKTLGLLPQEEHYFWDLKRTN